MISARSNLLIIACCLLLVLAAVSLYQLFTLRFEAGDIFPAGSSLRSDPVGSLALYQALERTDGTQVQRNYHQLSRYKQTGSTILLLGSSPRLCANRKEMAELEQLAIAGNRILIAFKPVVTAPEKAPEPASKTEQPPKKAAVPPVVSTGILPVSAAHPGQVPVRAALAAPELALPETARFISRLTLQPPPTGWQTIYAVEGGAMVLERRIGAGSLVLVSDSSIFSNEALKADRQSVLLTWLLGENHRIVFDETHLGVREQGGIMALARRFGLMPLLGVLLLMAGLYIWQQSIPLVPPVDVPSADLVIGVAHDSFSGLVNLLRRSIPANQLLKVCCQEWQKSFARELQHDNQLRKQLNDAMTAQDDPVVRYQRIARLRAERTGR